MKDRTRKITAVVDGRLVHFAVPVVIADELDNLRVFRKRMRAIIKQVEKLIQEHKT